MPCTKSVATAPRTMRSAWFSSRWISTRRAARSPPSRRSRSADATSLGGEHEHLGHLQRLLGRGLDPVEAELVGGLLGEVDDVVERAGEGVHVAGVEGAAADAVLGQAQQRLVRDPVALVLAIADRRGEIGLLGEVRQQVAQHRAGANVVVARGLEQGEELAVGLRPGAGPHETDGSPAGGGIANRSQPLHSEFTAR